ncbi:trefoil factor 2-like [Pituophis catenifer annectens]|uniref:trefoil factor 2-like n=1 Tax=Pituophis catenifer annectens TaxID=94852 RepID=UPI003996B937
MMLASIVVAKKIICHTLLIWDNQEFCLLTAKCRCDVDPHKRSNCGPPGITPQKCENSGCCFNSTVPGVPWCFKPTPPKYRKMCPADVEFRKDCGYPGISANECAKRKCCFKSKPPGVPWCFFRISVEEEY